MQREGMPLLVHGEVTDPAIDLFDREAVFIERQLIPLRRDFPELKIVLEHITTREARAVRRRGRRRRPRRRSPRTTCSTTATRSSLGGIRPHYYCLPVLKRETHRRALVEAATSGSAQFFLGTDSAPHPAVLKEHASGCAGCYTALTRARAVRRGVRRGRRARQARGFASFHGPAFYGLPRNTGTVTLKKLAWTAARGACPSARPS